MILKSKDVYLFLVNQDFFSLQHHSNQSEKCPLNPFILLWEAESKIWTFVFAFCPFCIFVAKQIFSVPIRDTK